MPIETRQRPPHCNRSKPAEPRRRGALRRSCAVAVAAGLLSLSPLASSGVAAEAAEARVASGPLAGRYGFEVRWSVFPDLILGQGEAKFSQLDETYELRMDASAKLAVPSINWKGSFAARGEGRMGEGRPLRFERRSTRPEIETAVVVQWSGEGEPPTTDTYVWPAGYTVRRDPVDPSQITDVVDPLTFMATILRRVERTNGQSCDVTMNTWDGSRLARISIQTAETVLAARTDCRVVYEDIQGLRADSPWRAEEQRTTRILRFVRKGLRWEPQFLRIEGTFLGYNSTFTTSITPLDR